MSVERIFHSNISGSVYRYGPSIQPGEVGYMVDLSGDGEKIIIALCDHEDEGGTTRTAEPDEFDRLNESEIFVAQDLIDEVIEADRQTGTLFEGRIRLIDGDEGTLVIRHSNSDSSKLN